MTFCRCLILGFMVLAISGTSSLFAQTKSSSSSPKTKILLIGKDRDHPPNCHEYMDECRLLAKCLMQTEGVETVVSKGWPKDAKVLEGVSTIVLYTGNGGNEIFNPKIRPQVEALLKEGVGLASIHWSTGADDGHNGAAQLENLGGWFGFSFSKFMVRESKIQQANPDHPISQGWKEFDFRDEYYTQLKFHPKAKPLLKAKLDGIDHVIGWTLERTDHQNGRSFGFVCGHFHDCFANESFRKIVVNAILWTAQRDIPQQGAPVVIKPEDLKLSPDPRGK